MLHSEFMARIMHRTVNLELEALRQQLDKLAQTEDYQLIEQYALRRSPVPLGLYWQLRWLVGWIVRWLEAIHIFRADPWPASLKQGVANAGARPLLIWAVGANRETLREACHGFVRMQESNPRLALVLVTDVADFAYFSRLGWLVEYLPEIAGQGQHYAERKAKFIARLYAGALVLPVSAGLENAGDFYDALNLGSSR